MNYWERWSHERDVYATQMQKWDREIVVRNMEYMYDREHKGKNSKLGQLVLKN